MISLLIFMAYSVAHASSLTQEAKASYDRGEYVRCTKIYEQILKSNKGDFSTPYNAACCAALSGQTDKAFNWLEKSVVLYPNLGHYQTDPDFKSLTSDSRWTEIIQKL